MPPPTETATPTGTPAPTVTPLPTRTPLPTLSPEAVATTEALVPGWVENRSELTSFLLSLKQIWPEASALLESLEWVQDGIGNSTSGRDILEVDLVSTLRDFWGLGPTGQEVVLGLLGKPWMQDNVAGEESRVVDSLWHIFRGNSVASMRLVQMPFLDTVDGVFETRTLSLVNRMLYDDRWALQNLLSNQEFADGITDDHVTALELINFERFDQQAAAAIRALPWIQDGTDASDLALVHELIDLSGISELFFQAALDLPLVKDGLSQDEFMALDSFTRDRRNLGTVDSEAAAAIEALPWLLDGVNRTEWDGALALMNLRLANITAFWSAIETGWVQDGITADEVRMISSLA